MSAVKPDHQPQGYLRRMTPPAVMILAALGLMLAVNAGVYGRGLWYWLPAQFEDSVKIYSLVTDPKKYDVVIIGSSVGDRGLISQVIEEELDRRLPRSEPWMVFNAAIGGGFMPSSIQTARHLGRRPSKPRLAMLMMTTLNCNSAARMELNIKLYSSGADILPVIAHAPRSAGRWAAVNSLEHGLTSIFQLPLLYRDRARVRQIQDLHGSTYIYPFDAAADAANARKLPAASRSIEELKEQRVGELRDLYLPNFSVPPLIDAWVAELADQLRRDGIPLVITMAPESRWFVATTYQGERETSVKFLRAFCQARGIPFVDLNDPPYSLRDTDFFDGCDHLGPRGAESLSRQITKNLFAPLLAKPAN